MARVALPLTVITRAGVAPGSEVTGDAVNGHAFPAGTDVFLLARNSNSGSTARTLTFRYSRGIDGQTVTRAESIPAGTSQYFGPFEAALFGSTVRLDVDHAELKLTAYRLAV